MIDIDTETLLTIKQARNEFPSRPSVPTLWRWMLKGIRGKVLESIRVGGRRFTSREACRRFMEPSCDESTVDSDNNAKKSSKMDSIARAKQVLDRFGI